jgi:acyl-CoA synthetase (AMP-forming)/AMP-acid ligase II
VPDPKWGEAVKACVQLKPGAGMSEDELIASCKAAIGSMQAPKSVDFIDELPRSPVGKVLKRELRAPYWSGRDRLVG